MSFITRAISANGIARTIKPITVNTKSNDSFVNAEKRVVVILRHLDDRNAEIFFEQNLFGNDVVKF